MTFDNESINLTVLKNRAYNLRWATIPDDVIPLTAADPDFPCAQEILESLHTYTSAGHFSYGPGEGLPEFRASVARFCREKRNIPTEPNQVLAVNSAAFGIYLVCQTVLQKGDEALVFDPVDFLFRYSIEAVDAVAIPFAIAPGTEKVNFHNLEKLITPKTKLICLCNPLNPTGKVFTPDELAILGEIAIRYNLLILSDEIWSDIVFPPAVFTSIASLSPEIRSRTILVTGYSKSYGLAGLRIGTVAAYDSDLFEKLYTTSLHASTINGVSTLSQIAALTALDQCDYWLDDFVEHLTKMRNLLVKEINSIPGFHCIAPDGCYVAFVNIKGTGMTSQEIRDLLYNKAKVAIVPGLPQWFGDQAEGYIRICFSTSEEILTEAINRIKKALT